MNRITATVRAPTPAGRLYPRYDRGTNCLVLESQVARPWVEGVDIDALMILDLDKDLVPANGDLHVPMSSWNRGLRHTFDWSAPAHDLAFTQATVDQLEFDIPVRCTADPDGKIVHIGIGTASHDRAIALSDRCLALLNKDELVGFVARDFGE